MLASRATGMPGVKDMVTLAEVSRRSIAQGKRPSFSDGWSCFPGNDECGAARPKPHLLSNTIFAVWAIDRARMAARIVEL
jgi:hypothetical protein